MCGFKSSLEIFRFRRRTTKCFSTVCTEQSLQQMKDKLTDCSQCDWMKTNVFSLPSFCLHYLNILKILQFNLEILCLWYTINVLNCSSIITQTFHSICSNIKPVLMILTHFGLWISGDVGCSCMLGVCVVTVGTLEQFVCAHVAESEADDRGLVQVSSDRRLQRQETAKSFEYVRLHPPPLPGCLTADRPADGRHQDKKMEASQLDYNRSCEEK